MEEDFAEWKQKQLVCVYVCVRERESACVRVSMCMCSCVCIYICKQMYIQIHSSNTTSNERGGCMIESSQQKRGNGAGRQGSVHSVPVACISSPLRSFKKNSTPNLHPSAASSSAQHVSYTQGQVLLKQTRAAVSSQGFFSRSVRNPDSRGRCRLERSLAASPFSRFRYVLFKFPIRCTH